MDSKSYLYHTFCVVGMIFTARYAEAFVSPEYSSIHSIGGMGPLYSEPGQSGRMERIEFKIFPDGRVEEKVIGVKGESCLEVTREINEKLGNVISSAPTEEMYEEEVTIDQTLINGNVEGDGSSWEGSSSW